MNILYLTNHLNIGGITSYVYTLARGMKQRGHSVYLASGKGELMEEFKQEGISLIPVPMKTKKEISPKIILSMLRLSKIIKEKNIDLVHSHTRTTQVLGCLLNSFLGTPHVSTCHGFFEKRLIRKIFPCWGDAVIAISEPVKEHLVRDFKVDDKKIFIIHNGIDVEKSKIQNPKSKIEIKKEFGLKEGPVVGIVARLSDVKGHIYLIKAIDEVLKINPCVQLLIVGEGKIKGELEELVKTLGIERNVFFIPRVSDTKNVLSAMDIFVMPSLKEGLGLALMEAMASGLSVIGSDVGGIKSLIQHGYNGLLVKPKDPGHLQEAILELLNDESKRKFLGKNAKDHITQNFSIDKMVSETLEVYSGCILKNSDSKEKTWRS
jgi:glycosyltransferase involved in cell wall biosynthesis